MVKELSLNTQKVEVIMMMILLILRQTEIYTTNSLQTMLLWLARPSVQEG